MLVLVLVRLFVCARRAEPRRAEEGHQLRAIAGQGIQLTEPFDRFGDHSQFFVTFATRGGRGILAGIDAAGRQLPQPITRRMTVLLHKHHGIR